MLRDSLNITGLLKKIIGLFTRRQIFVFIIGLLCLSLISWFTLLKIKQQTQQDVIHSLQEAVISTKKSIHVWLEKQSGKAADGIQINKVRQSLTLLLEAQQTGQNLKSHQAVTEIQDSLRYLVADASISDFLFITPDGITLAAMGEDKIGVIPNFYKRAEAFKHPQQGAVELTLPLSQDFSHSYRKQKKHATSSPFMYLTVPVFDQQKHLMAFFSLQMLPEFFLSTPWLPSKSQIVGDYIFYSTIDTQSELFSLFKDPPQNSNQKTHIQPHICSKDGRDLQKRIGIAEKPNEKVSLPVYGVNINGYQDCHGNTMVGAWSWDNKYELVFVYQLESKYAYHSYHTIRIFILSAFGCLITFFSTFYFMLDRKKGLFQETAHSMEEKTAKYKAILNSLDEAVLLIDTQARVTFWNEGATALFGYSRKEALGTLFYDLIIPDESKKEFLEGLLEYLNSKSKTQPIPPREIRTLAKDGSELQVELSFNMIPMYDQWWTVGTFHDIRDRKKVEHSLKLSETRLKEAQHIARIGYWELDINSNYLQWSQDLFTIFEMDPEIVTPTYELFSEIIHPSDRDQVHKSYINSVSQKSHYDIEYRLLMKNGNIKYVNERGKSEYDSSGAPRRSVGTVQDITERRMREIEFQTLSERFQLATNVAELGIWDWNIVTDNTYWDDTMYHLYGTNRSEGLSPQAIIRERIHPDDFEHAKISFTKALKTQKNLDTIFRLIQPDGKIIHIKSDAKIYRDSFGRAIRMIGTHVDISDNIAKEQKLQTLSQRLQLATKGAKVGVWDWHLPSNALIWDELMLSLYGIHATDFSENFNSWKTRIHKDDVEQVEDDLQKALNGIKDFDTRFRITLDTGKIRYLRSKATVQLDENGAPLRLVGVSYDISQTVEAQKALETLNEELENRIFERTTELEKSKKAAMSIMQDANLSKQHAEDTLTKLKDSQSELIKLYSAVEASPVSVIITDQDGTIEYVNPKFTEVTGYSYDETCKQNPRILKSNEQPDSFYKQLWETLKSGKEWHGEFCNRKKDGSIFWEQTSISPILDENKQITHYVAVKEDISEKKEAQKKLHKALNQAKEATKAKSDFLANMSHEIRTPMNAIIGMAHLALQTNLSAQQHDYVTKINSSAKSLLNIINDILDFSKIEAGKLTIENIPFNFSAMLNDVITLNAGSFAERNIELLIFLDQDIPAVLVGDPVRISQIFNNLLSNSVKFTLTGEVELKVHLLEWWSNSLKLECSVTDSGIGMTEDQASNLFQKFSQADSSTTRKFGGTGLGLAITKQLVEMMNGIIEVESSPGKGTCFTFTLQLNHRPDRRRLPHPQTVPHNLRDIKILLMQEKNKASDFLIQQLQSMSFHITQTPKFENLKEKVRSAELQQSSFELIIIDFPWYESNEEKLSSFLHDNTQLSTIPTILVTTVKDLIKAENFARHSRWRYILNKPITSSALFNSIVEAFGYSELKTGKCHSYGSDNTNTLASIRGSSILLAEDNTINQQVALEILGKADITVTVANNGLEVLNLLKTYDFDLILMDIQMPMMDGLSTTRKIRELTTKIKDIPIIAMTAHAMVGDRQRSLDAGMQDHLTKPINPDELYNCLAQQIGSQNNQKMDVGTPKRRKSDIVDNDFSDFPAKIQGISLEAGLKRIGGNKKLYLKLLQDFLEENENFSSQISNALAKGDRDTAIRNAHTLKGTAGNIGATLIQEKAATLETMIREEIPDILIFLNSLDTVLQETLSNILSSLPIVANGGSEDKQKSSLDIKTLLERMDKLNDLLNVNDMDAESLFSKLHFILENYNSHQTEQLANAIESFDFKLAQIELARLRSKLFESE